MSWPQWVWIVLVVYEVVHAGWHHGEMKKTKHNVGESILAAAIGIWLLYMGGFFSGGVR